jgi:hypothetical protein
MTFLLSEDKALRELLQGVTVHDQRADGDDVPRQVGVWFGQPDQELRAQIYPYITIDMIDINRDPAREMRGLVNNVYLRPAGLPVGQDFEIPIPIPVTVDYQITTYARHPRHDRELIATLLYTKLPLRFGILELDDNTVRRLDVVDVSKRDVTENGKRLFVNSITVRVSSEIAEETAVGYEPVSQIGIVPPVTENEGGRPGAPTFVGVDVTVTD